MLAGSFFCFVWYDVCYLQSFSVFFRYLLLVILPVVILLFLLLSAGSSAGDGKEFTGQIIRDLIVEEHLESQGVVYVITHVGIEDDRNGFDGRGAAHQQYNSCDCKKESFHNQLIT